MRNISQGQDQWEGIITTGIRTATLPTPGIPITSVANIDPQIAIGQELNVLRNNATSTLALPTINTIHTHVVTCSTPLCQSNVMTNTQSYFNTTSARLQDHTSIFNPGLAHTYQTSSREYQEANLYNPPPIMTQRIQLPTREGAGQSHTPYVQQPTTT